MFSARSVTEIAASQYCQYCDKSADVFCINCDCFYCKTHNKEVHEGDATKAGHKQIDVYQKAEQMRDEAVKKHAAAAALDPNVFEAESASDSSQDDLEFVSTPRASPTHSFPSTSTDTAQTTTDDATTESDEDEDSATATKTVGILRNPEVDTAEKLFFVLQRRGADDKVYFNKKDLGKLVKKYRDDMPRILIQLAGSNSSTLDPAKLYPYDLFTNTTKELVDMVYNVQMKRVGDNKANLTSTIPPQKDPKDEVSTIKTEALKLERLMRRDAHNKWKLQPYQLRRVWGESVRELASTFKAGNRAQGVQNFRAVWEEAFAVTGIESATVDSKANELDVEPLLSEEEATAKYATTVHGSRPDDFKMLYGQVVYYAAAADTTNDATDAFSMFGVDENEVQVALEQLQTEVDEEEEIEVLRKPPRAAQPHRPPPVATPHHTATATALAFSFSASPEQHVALDRDSTRRWLQPGDFSKDILPTRIPPPYMHPPIFLCGPIRPARDHFYAFTLPMLYVSACNPVFYYTMLRETYHDKKELLAEENTSLVLTLYRVMSRYYSLYPIEDWGTIPDGIKHYYCDTKSLYDYFMERVKPDWVESHYLNVSTSVSTPTETLSTGGDVVLLALLQERAVSGSLLPWTRNITTEEDTSLHFSLTMDMNVGPSMTGEWAKYQVSAVLIDDHLLLRHLGTWYKITGHTGNPKADVDISLYDTKGHSLCKINPRNKGFVLVNRIR